MRRVLLIGSALLSLAGCHHPVTPSEAGPYPSDYRNIVKDEVMKRSPDPYSLRNVKISTPHAMGWLATEGWEVCYHAYGKCVNGIYSGTGIYCGEADAGFLIKNDKIIREGPEEQCKYSDYSPWPEMENIDGQSQALPK